MLPRRRRVVVPELLRFIGRDAMACGTSKPTRGSRPVAQRIAKQRKKPASSLRKAGREEPPPFWLLRED